MYVFLGGGTSPVTMNMNMKKINSINNSKKTMKRSIKMSNEHGHQ